MVSGPIGEHLQHCCQLPQASIHIHITFSVDIDTSCGKRIGLGSPSIAGYQRGRKELLEGRRAAGDGRSGRWGWLEGVGPLGITGITGMKGMAQIEQLLLMGN